jgi:hypothetical protein
VFLFSLQKCGSLKSEYFYWWFVSHNIGRIKLSLDDGFFVAIFCFTPIEKEYPLLGIDSGLWCLLLQPRETSFALVEGKLTFNQANFEGSDFHKKEGSITCISGRWSCAIGGCGYRSCDWQPSWGSLP